MSKMGISTYQSYCGAQIFDAVGLRSAFVKKYFTGTHTQVEGVGLRQIARETAERHRQAFGDVPVLDSALDVGGEYAYRIRGEAHMWRPGVVADLQHAVRGNLPDKYRSYAQQVNDQSEQLMTLRGLFRLKSAEEMGRKPVPLDEVEPAAEIVKRFSTGAMSFGSISREAHTTLAIAMNRIGGKSNTGEGGEEADRFKPLPNGDSLRSAIKQVASGRFGVTAEYLVNSSMMQIKMAQGAKPGEGGQLPGHKVDAVIAKVRHSTPGVGLISPPPHHDIYSTAARVMEEIASADGSAGWALMIWGAGCELRGDAAARVCARQILRQRRHRRGHGEPDRPCGMDGDPRARLRRIGTLALRQRQQPRDLVRRRMHGLRRRPAPPRRERRPCVAHGLRPPRRRHGHRHLGHTGAARHRQQRLQHRRRLRAGGAGLPDARDAAATPLGALPLAAPDLHQPRHPGPRRGKRRDRNCDRDRASKRGWGNVPLRELPRIQAVIAEATALVDAASCYLYDAAQRLWDLVLSGGDDAVLRARVRLATSNATTASLQAVDLLHGALATAAIFTKSPLERQFRDMHTAAAHVMIGAMTYEAAGRVILGLDPQFPFF